jgi:nifR3 family TIM-barrel protein
MKEVSVGGLRLSPPLVMAPMAGLTNIAFRRLLAELGGVGLFYSEMLSARALVSEKPGQSSYLAETEAGRPLCTQIFAARPGDIAPAVEKGEEWSPDAWDLNLGCPAPSVVKQGAGSALLEDGRRVREMARAMRRSVRGPLIFKIRVLGDEDRFRDILAMLVDEGADAIVVHGRYPREKLGRPSRQGKIRFAASVAGIPVVGNGDVTNASGALSLMERTGCAAVMIGRGGVARPWLFREAATAFKAKLPPLLMRTKSEVFVRMAELLQECYGTPGDMPRLRTFAKYFASNYKYGHQFWKTINSAGSVEEAAERAVSFGVRQGSEDRLYEETLV